LDDGGFSGTFPPLLDIIEEVLDCLECLALLDGVTFFLLGSNGSLLFKKSNNASSVFNFFLALPVCAVVDDGLTMVCGFLMDGVTISDGL
jgi:hypothetical protein